MKSYDDIKSEVASFIATTLGVPSEQVQETSVIADLSRDSIQLFELLLAFEKKYGIETTYEDVIEMHTIRDVIAYIARVYYRVLNV